MKTRNFFGLAVFLILTALILHEVNNYVKGEVSTIRIRFLTPEEMMDGNY